MEKLLVIAKEQPSQNGGTFTKLFCYRQVNVAEEGQEPRWVDDVNPTTGKPTSVTVKLTDHFKKEHQYNEKEPSIDGMQFPLYFDVSMEDMVEVVTKSGKNEMVNECYITVDKTSEGKPRIDKNGNRHPLCVISVAKRISEAPRRTITWDNVYDVK